MRQYRRGLTERTPNFAVVFLELEHALEVFDCLKQKVVTSAIEHVTIEIEISRRGAKKRNKAMSHDGLRDGHPRVLKRDWQKRLAHLWVVFLDPCDSRNLSKP